MLVERLALEQLHAEENATVERLAEVVEPHQVLDAKGWRWRAPAAEAVDRVRRRRVADVRTFTAYLRPELVIAPPRRPDRSRLGRSCDQGGGACPATIFGSLDFSRATASCSERSLGGVSGSLRRVRACLRLMDSARRRADSMQPELAHQVRDALANSALAVPTGGGELVNARQVHRRVSRRGVTIVRIVLAQLLDDRVEPRRDADMSPRAAGYRTCRSRRPRGASARRR